MKTRRINRLKRNKNTKNKKQFFFNPDDPANSFDVYIDKNPNYFRKWRKL